MRNEDELDASKVDDRRHLVNWDFEPFDDSDSPDEALMFEPGDIPE